MATSWPVDVSIAVYTVPDALCENINEKFVAKKKNLKYAYPCPIFYILVYLRLGSPTLTINRNFSRISSSDIFFFRTFGVGAFAFLLRSKA